MTEHEEVLEGTVDEAKDSIRNLDDPDYESLLEAEKEDKNRKTLVSWLESRAYEEPHGEETGGESEQEDSGGEGEREDPGQVDEAVEEVERQTAGGLGGGFSSGQIALAGLLVGLIIGLASGALVGEPGASTEPDASTSQIQEDVSSLVSRGTQDVSVASVEKRNEMFFVNVSATVTQNGTSQELERAFYVSRDGELLFPRISRPRLVRRAPVNIADSLAAARNQTGAGQ